VIFFWCSQHRAISDEEQRILEGARRILIVELASAANLLSEDEEAASGSLLKEIFDESEDVEIPVEEAIGIANGVALRWSGLLERLAQ
jgi:hypothetical protein